MSLVLKDDIDGAVRGRRLSRRPGSDAWNAFIIALGLALGLLPVRGNATGVEWAAAIMESRVAPPEQSAIEAFASAGMRDTRSHVLTPSERRRVQAALAALPAFHRDVLGKKLRRLSFVDGISSQGSGLTAPVGATGQFDITLRASLIDESLSTFLTTKDRRLFAPDRSQSSILIEATGTNALTFVLLHEATHVADLGAGIAAKMKSPLVAGVWQTSHRLAPRFAGSAAARTVFRGGQKIDVSKARTIYDALARTPFVSLYATASAQEDLAELVAWSEILKQFHGTLVITIFDAKGKQVRRHEPLNFPLVKSRLARVDELLTLEASRL